MTGLRDSRVELVEVSKSFRRDGTAAIRDVNLTIEPGSALLVRGPSGSGKTTLLGLIACLIRPTSGRIRVGDDEVTRLPEDRISAIRRRRFGVVFQDHHLVRRASALDNVALPAVPRNDVDGELHRDSMALLARFGLGGLERQRIETLSGGQRQRVAIARALINDPPVFLADEPTSHLDAEASIEFLGLLRELQAEGRTVVVASHDPLVCDSGCFRTVIDVRHGKLE